MSTAAIDANALTPRRSLALDALRGIAILTMILSGMVPKELPAWMHHAQVVQGKFDPAVPGITWVDLVFPFFLFALGAAIPFALRRRMEKGMTNLQAIGTIAKRGVLLLVFANFQQHVGCWSIQGKTGGHALPMLLALAGFLAMTLVLVRLPDKWSPSLHWVLRIAGWALGAGLIWYVYGAAYSYKTNNIILWLLAQAAVFGSLAWLFTRNSILPRLGILGVLMAVRLAGGETGWTQWLNANASIPGIFSMGPLAYLFIVIPGTIAGDLLQQWMRSPAPAAPETPRWSATHLWGVAALMLLLVVAALVGLAPQGVPDKTLGLFARWSPIACPALIALALVTLVAFRNPATATERTLRSLYLWGLYWLILGLVFEPYEAGIKKDPATMSYFFVTAGLAITTLIGLVIVIDLLDHRRWFSALLIENGQNPMIAYVGFAHLIFPVMALTGIASLLDKVFTGPALGMTRGVLQTLLLAVVVSLFTRAKFFWRS